MRKNVYFPYKVHKKMTYEVEKAKFEIHFKFDPLFSNFTGNQSVHLTWSESGVYYPSQDLSTDFATTATIGLTGLVIV